MNEKKILADTFEARRPHLNAVAYRMLGSRSEAEDAVQEAWLRLGRTDAEGIENLGGWLTTVVARICLDILRARKSRREEPLEADGPSDIASIEEDRTVEDAIELADSVGLAMLVVLEALAPGERVAFVLHDMFDLPFDEIAPIVGRSPEAARQLASRARRRVQGRPAAADAGRERRREIVDAFLAASRDGDFEALLSVLDPDVVFRADPAAMRLGSAAELRGATPVAEYFKGRARTARTALIDGAVGIAVVMGGAPRIVLKLTIAGERVTGIEAVAEQERLEELDLEILD